MLRLRLLMEISSFVENIPSSPSGNESEEDSEKGRHADAGMFGASCANQPIGNLLGTSGKAVASNC